MRNLLPILLAAICALLNPSCEHRPLSDPNNAHYIRIYLDEQIKNVTCDFYDPALEHPEYTRPKVLRVAVFDPATDKLVAERFLQNQGSDERGHYFDGYIGIPAGEYNLITYSFGSAVTMVRNEDSFYQMEAYTNPISDHYLQYIPSSRNEVDQSNILNAPEHLFHSVAQPVVIDDSPELDTLLTAEGDYFTAHSMVKSYYLQVKVQGFEWIRTAVSMLGGMAESSLLHGHDKIESSNPAQVFFAMKYANKERTRDNSTSATLYATFNTFGKLPDVPSIYTLNLEFVRSDGTSQVEQIDITPMFDTPMVRDNRWIIIDKEIVITPPEGGASGGMSPGVESWENVEGGIQI
ncbi:MAG: DUF5119 domain-containing protein [Alistipes sp.]|nr:DUF5119 domain-containing protein [Alistipes sp.]